MLDDAERDGAVSAGRGKLVSAVEWRQRWVALSAVECWSGRGRPGARPAWAVARWASSAATQASRSPVRSASMIAWCSATVVARPSRSERHLRPLRRRRRLRRL